VEINQNLKLRIIHIILNLADKIGISSITFRTIEAVHIAKLRLLNRNLRHSDDSAPDGTPVPPVDLILSVSGTLDISWFIKSGELAIQSIIDTMQRNGLNTAEFQSILDFGCGCGRVIKHGRFFEDAEIHGTDYNPKSIKWCKLNIPFAHFATNKLIPPLHYGGSQFDFIYALSVFTHLPERAQFLWINELQRVLKPQGYLLITTHGEHYFDTLSSTEQKQFRSGNLVVRHKDAAGTNLCCAYHPQKYVQQKLVKGFEIIDFVPQGAKGNPHQDLYLMRKSPTAFAVVATPAHV